MKKLLLVIITLLYMTPLKAQFLYDLERDEQSGQTMFVGQCVFEDIEEQAEFDWFKTISNDYSPNTEVISKLKKVLPTYQIIIFMGTWCEDTHSLLPKLYKTLLLSHCFTNYKMYGVNREKKTKNNLQAKYNIENIPTIILIKDNIEVGRIVESIPSESTIEQELLKITELK